MANTSGTYNFQSITAERIINDAYRKIGVPVENITPEQLDSARMSINLLLLEWQNETVNLFSRKTAYLGLTPYQSKYTLPNIVSKIIQANLRTYTRLLQGTSQSNTLATYDGNGGGIPANAFDDNPATACTQTGINGNISYDYGLLNAVLTNITRQTTFVGLQSSTTTNYSIVIEYSQDTATWTNLYTLTPQVFTAGQIVWFDIPTPVFARAYRVREIGGATLSMQEIYFSNNTNDIDITNISWTEYLSRPNKNQTGRPNIYYFDRQMIPTVSILPVPSVLYNCLQYSYIEKMQDVGNYSNAVDIPSHYYPTLVAGLSFALSMKPTNNVSPDQIQLLRAEYMNSFTAISRSDTESTPITIYADYESGYF